MKIENCAGKYIKISKKSITVKDDNDKTIGVITGIERCNNGMVYRKIEKFKCLECINGFNLADDYVIMKNDKVYVFRNIHGVKYQCEETLNKWKNVYEIAGKNDITIIECTM